MPTESGFMEKPGIEPWTLSIGELNLSKYKESCMNIYIIMIISTLFF